MLLVKLRLDEEKILSDNRIDLNDAYRAVTDAYESKGAYLFAEEDGAKYYTRDRDDDDFQYLWMVNLALDKTEWFRQYVCCWSYVETDEDGKIEYEEDLIPGVRSGM